MALVGFTALTLAVGVSMPALGADRAEPGSDPSEFGPLPAGFSVVYLFPGARTIGTTVATSVHCTNIHNTSAVDVRVEFYDFNGVLVGANTGAVGASVTRTVSASDSGATVFYDEDAFVVVTSPINQGVVRVLKKGTPKVICTAQVLDAASSPPSFAIPLPHFLSTGAH
jgi:hypothetical protein